MRASPPRACQVDGCDRDHKAKGYCRKHYSEAQRGKRPLPPPPPRQDEGGDR